MCRWVFYGYFLRATVAVPSFVEIVIFLIVYDMAGAGIIYYGTVAVYIL